MLRFGRVAPTLVESYVGPPELLAGARQGPAPTAGQLLEETRALRSVLAEAGELGRDRREWLKAQLAARLLCEQLTPARLEAEATLS